MTNGFNWSLSDLVINLNSNPEYRRPLSREESFVLAWIAFHPDDRSYGDLMRDCQLSSQQFEIAIQGLIELDLLLVR